MNGEMTKPVVIEGVASRRRDWDGTGETAVWIGDDLPDAHFWTGRRYRVTIEEIDDQE